MKNNSCYESDWRPYVFPKAKANFASPDEIKNKYSKVDFNAEDIDAGGLPVISDGKTGYINTETEHTIIFGETGSGKSRKLIAPLIANLAKAGESMIVFDIKGEFSTGTMSSGIMGILNDCEYNLVFLDFRGLESDGYNLLEYPYTLLNEGKKDEAMVQISNIAQVIGSVYDGSKADPFWEITAKQYIISVMMMIFKYCRDINKINFLSLATYTTLESCNIMSKIARKITSSDNIVTMLRSILSEPERTLASTLASANSILEIFISNEKLLKMMSKTTFSLSDIYEKKTALFIIVPDEVKTYDRICGIILSQINSMLVCDAYKYNGALPRRVNIVCDEACNYTIPNIGRNISTNRSRNIRWYLSCQSKKQFENTYEKDADTTMANCANTYFLSSSELSLLTYLSEKAGRTEATEDGDFMPILSVQDLQSLKKGWEFTEVYFTSKNISFVTKLPDVNAYEFMAPYAENKKCELPKLRRRQFLKTYTASEMLFDLNEAMDKAQKDGMDDGMELSDEMQQKLDKRFDEIFGKKQNG